MSDSTEGSRITRAFCTLDCAHKKRVHYYLPSPVDVVLLDVFPDAELEVQEFSRFVSDAKDHFTLTSPAFHASGVIGEERIIVTYGKLGDGPGDPGEPGDPGAEFEMPVDYDAVVQGFEARLASAGLGPVVYSTVTTGS